eukprot:1966032-Amphidinium_carterae.1
MSTQDAMKVIFVDHDEVIEFTDDGLESFWKKDSMHDTYQSLAPTWLSTFKSNCLVNGMSSELNQ